MRGWNRRPRWRCATRRLGRPAASRRSAGRKPGRPTSFPYPVMPPEGQKRALKRKNRLFRFTDGANWIAKRRASRYFFFFFLEGFRFDFAAAEASAFFASVAFSDGT